MFLKITEPEYRGINLPSYSKLASIDELGPEGMNKVFKPSDVMLRGSLVDTMLFEPQLVSSRYYVIP